MLKTCNLKTSPVNIIIFLSVWFVSYCSEAKSEDWVNKEGYNFRKLNVSKNGQPGFSQVSTNQTAVAFTNLLSKKRYTTNQIYLNGSGVAAGDYDGDGLCDLFFCGLDSENKLYRNLGNWKFEDVTSKAKVRGGNIASTGCVFADVNGNGHLDLVVNSVGQGTWVLINTGDGVFRAIRPINLRKGGMSMALADIDGDSDLDLYVTNYRTTTIRDEPGTKLKGRNINGKPVVVSVNGKSLSDSNSVGRFSLKQNGKIIENGQSDSLFLNDGKGRFTSVPFNKGSFLDEDGKTLSNPLYDWGLSVMFRDINQDGLPDLYVCNDFESPDRIWINKGKGIFQAIDRLALRKSSHFSMGVDFSDINRDGLDDFIVADMLSRKHSLRNTQLSNRKSPEIYLGKYDDRPQYSYNTVYLNQDNKYYTEVGFYTGLAATEWSWSPVFIDVDLDGFEDFLITTGHPLDMQDMDVTNEGERLKNTRKRTARELLEMRFMFKPLVLENLAFRNNGKMKFTECSDAWGFNNNGISHGMALADLDNDGDLDIAVNNFNQTASLYRNNSSAPRVTVTLKGIKPNTHGIGARVLVKSKSLLQSQEIVSGGRYLSGDESRRTFAAKEKIENIRVIWRSGRESKITNILSNTHYEIHESNSIVPKPITESAPTTLFTDVSHIIGHNHVDQSYDDYSRQSLLPKKLSQEGPGVSWVDWNDDGFSDVAIPSGRGGKTGLYLNDKKGGFKKLDLESLNKSSIRDQVALLELDSSKRELLVLQSNYEDGLTVGVAIEKHIINSSNPLNLLDAGEIAFSVFCSSDYDGDGDLDLFVGGRCVTGSYPASVDSLLLENINGDFQINKNQQESLSEIGSVSSAVWTDVLGDHLPELIISCDPGMILIFQNNDGVLINVTKKVGLNNAIGFWNSVNSGDFNGDGRIDLICGNLGGNSGYEIFRDRDLVWHVGDLSGGGINDVFESYYPRTVGELSPIRTYPETLSAIPFLREVFSNYSDYASANTSQLLGGQIGELRQININKIESVIYLNHGGRFEMKDLPINAQLSPVFGISVSDFDGDGFEDAFLAQNFFGTRPGFPRLDSGRGLLLKGKGDGDFIPLSPSESGLDITGDQRGAAFSDYNKDGKVDLLVGQNNGQSKLYQNRNAKRGLIVHLKGLKNNPKAIGSKIQLVSMLKKGPIREIKGGGGYRSQDSAIQVMSLNDSSLNKVRVVWPSGKVSETSFSSESKIIELKEPSK